MLPWYSNDVQGVLTTGGNLLTSSSDTDDDALSPSLVASLESSTHDADVTSAVEREVAAAVGKLNELVDHRLVSELGGVDEIRRAELSRPLLLVGVNVNDDNLSSLVHDGTLNDGETDAAGTEDGDVVALLDVGGNSGGAVSGGDTAAQQASAVHGSILLDGND